MRSLRKLNCLGVHRIRDEHAVGWNLFPHAPQFMDKPLDFVAYTTVPEACQDAHVNRTSTG